MIHYVLMKAKRSFKITFWAELCEPAILEFATGVMRYAQTNASWSIDFLGLHHEHFHRDQKSIDNADGLIVIGRPTQAVRKALEKNVRAVIWFR